jgi:peroxiredoxin
MMKRMLLLSMALLASLGLFAQNVAEEDPDFQYAATLLKPGTPAPDFTLQDVNGKPVSSKDFLGKKVVLVFWASWCPDCREEIPLLKKMQSKADPDKVAFVSISFDRKFEALCTYVKEKEVPGVQLFDPQGMKESTIGAAYGVKWIPSLYLIGPDGKVKLGTVVLDKIAAAL